VLSLDDYLARRSFADEICRNSYFIDIHHALADVHEDNAARREGLKHAILYGPGESHGIPYRCLMPRGLRNVLVAGRSISCERIVQGSVRVMPVCLAMGEAAGIAAAAAAHAMQQCDNDVHAVDTAHLRQRLAEAGAGQYGLNFWKNFAAKHGKPFSIPEWGVNNRGDKHGGLDNAYFVEQMHKFITDPANNVYFHCYFDVQAGDGHHQLSPGLSEKEVTEFPLAAAKFKALFGLSQSTSTASPAATP